MPPWWKAFARGAAIRSLITFLFILILDIFELNDSPADGKTIKHIVRWVHKVHHHRTMSTDIPSNSTTRATERLGPQMLPLSYSTDNLVDEFVKYWAKAAARRLERKQVDALRRFRGFRFEIGKSTDQYPLPYEFFIETFDDYFFLGALREHIEVETVPHLDRDFGAWGQTTGLMRPYVVRIDMNGQNGRTWSSKLIKEALGTLLHEMVHAYFRIYDCPVVGWVAKDPMMEGVGFWGHGPGWREVALAVEREANRSFRGTWGDLHLSVEFAKQVDERKLARWMKSRTQSHLD